jgi:hypothetical protein
VLKTRFLTGRDDFQVAHLRIHNFGDLEVAPAQLMNFF